MPWYESFDQLISRELPGLAVLREEPMAGHTTFRIGGPARRMVFPASPEEMAALLSLVERENWPWMAIGNGSDLLAADEGLDMLVIATGRMDKMERIGEDTIRAWAGVSLAKLAVFAMEQGLEGFAFAHGIPGSLGGGVYMNAGAYGGEMCQVVASVTAWLPRQGVVELKGDELDFGYRHSCFGRNGGVALFADIKLKAGDSQTIRREMEDLIRRRREKQPLEYPSAGSTFKRPEGHYAAALIEQCGLKGAAVGGAMVSSKHSGFIINTGSATCGDVLALIRQVQEEVFRQTGVHLEPEVRILKGPKA